MLGKMGQPKRDPIGKELGRFIENSVYKCTYERIGEGERWGSRNEQVDGVHMSVDRE